MGPWEHTGDDRRRRHAAAVPRRRDAERRRHVPGPGAALRSCHDHKFDPVPTRDYYRIQAVFASTQFAERPAPFLPSENVDRASPKPRPRSSSGSKEAAGRAASLRQKSQQAIAAYLKERGVERFEDLPKDGRPNKGEFGLSKQELSLRKITRKRMDYFERELERFEPLAFSVYSGAAERLFVRQAGRHEADAGDGTHAAAGDAHPHRRLARIARRSRSRPACSSAVHGSNDRLDHAVEHDPADDAGRRLALARWIASPQNTLTARVIVNRVWQQHFGRGLVATPNNFGKMGAKPTHPELLDWLATWFVENGWSLKKLHRLIVTLGDVPAGGRAPGHGAPGARSTRRTTCWPYFPPRRLAAEEMRDAMLAASGELNPEMGGPGVFPEINWEVAFQPRHIMGSVAPAYQPSRTPRRAQPPDDLRLPLPHAGRPDAGGVQPPRQRDVVRAARRDDRHAAGVRAVQQRVRARPCAGDGRRAAEGRRDRSTIRVALAFRARLRPGARRTTSCASAPAHVAQDARPPPRSTRRSPCRCRGTVARHMVEEMTGEDVHWDEELDGLKDYQRDLMPWDADAGDRALAELCLVLLNSNEFLYVEVAADAIDPPRLPVRPRRDTRHRRVQRAAARRSGKRRTLAGPLAPKPPHHRREGEGVHLPVHGGRALATSTRSTPSRSWPTCT